MFVFGAPNSAPKTNRAFRSNSSEHSASHSTSSSCRMTLLLLNAPCTLRGFCYNRSRTPPPTPQQKTNKKRPDFSHEKSGRSSKLVNQTAAANRRRLSAKKTAISVNRERKIIGNWGGCWLRPLEKPNRPPRFCSSFLAGAFGFKYALNSAK